MSPLSPLTLPWTTLRLAGRFFVPLALWYTVGELLKLGLGFASFTIGLKNDVVPLMGLGLTVLVTLTVTVAMLHSVRDGLPALKAKPLDGLLAPWRAGEDESLFDAVSRSLFPFLIFYLAWGILAEDARTFVRGATSRGLAEGGIEGGTQGLGQAIAIEKHLGIAIGLTVAFYVLKTLTERFLLPRSPRVGGVLFAVFELYWALLTLFTIAKALGSAFDWVQRRVLWTGSVGRVPDIPVVGDAFGWLRGEAWPLFMDGVLLTLVWLVIAGVILGVHLTEDDVLAARSRKFGRVHGRLQRMRVVQRDAIEELGAGEFREKWVPTLNGIRLVRKSGVLAFAVLCLLYTALSLFDEGVRRGIYDLLGAETIGWWAPRAATISFVVGMVAEILRICLLAAAFDLVIARAAARGAPPAPVPPAPAAPGGPHGMPPQAPPYAPSPAPPVPVPAGTGGRGAFDPFSPFSARSAGRGPDPSGGTAPPGPHRVPGS